MDVSDPRFLPPGTYELTDFTASCDANARPPSSISVVVRKDLGVNVPMPTRVEGAWVAGRQDLDLEARRSEHTSTSDARCPGGTVRHVVEIADLSATKIRVRRSEEMLGCSSPSAPSCSVDYTLKLLESACTDPDDRACVTDTVLRVGEARVDVRCVCNR